MTEEENKKYWTPIRNKFEERFDYNKYQASQHVAFLLGIDYPVPDHWAVIKLKDVKPKLTLLLSPYGDTIAKIWEIQRSTDHNDRTKENRTDL